MAPLSRDQMVFLRAKRFARHVRDNPTQAFYIPDDIIDWLKCDGEEPVLFINHLKELGLKLRSDNRWEA